MIDVLIRKGVAPDIGIISRFNHSLKTSHVWQMQQSLADGEISTRFIETSLPREMRIIYPRSPELLESRWGDFSAILIGCIDHTPVGYIALNAFFATNLVWVKDLVVDVLWRKKGIATKLINTAVDWAKARGIYRITLEMSSKNFPTINLARKLNFEYSGFNDNYFQNNDIAVFFTRNLRKDING